MTKYSWSSYAGTKDPYILPVQKGGRYDSRAKQYGFNESLVTQLTDNDENTEVFEFGRSCGFYILFEAKSDEQAGLMFRKILKEAVLSYIGHGTKARAEELDLGVDYGIPKTAGGSGRAMER